jgi:hypothetical protein
LVLGLVPCLRVLHSRQWPRKGVGLLDVARPAGGLDVTRPVAGAGGAVGQGHDVIDRGAAGMRSLAAIDLCPPRKQLALAYLARPVVSAKDRRFRERLVVAPVLNASKLVAASVAADIQRVDCVIAPGSEPHSDLLVKRCPRPPCKSRARQAKPPRLKCAFPGAVFSGVPASSSLSERLLATEALPLRSTTLVSFDRLGCPRQRATALAAKLAARVPLLEAFSALLARLNAWAVGVSALVATVF